MSEHAHHRRRHPQRAAGPCSGWARTGSSLRELASVVTRLPQILVKRAGASIGNRTDDAELTEAVALEQDKLGDSGRILLRPSGTEPLVRVMVEASSPEEGQGRRRPSRRTSYAGASRSDCPRVVRLRCGSSSTSGGRPR